MSATEVLSEKYRTNIVSKFIKTSGIISHQLNSFNDFLNFGIARVVKENIIQIKKKDQACTISFGDVYIPPPTIIEEDRKVRPLYPHEARTRDLTYESTIFIDIREDHIVNGEKETTIHNRVPICKLPIMLGCDKCNLYTCSKSDKISHGECEYDEGGYFIIKGKERVLVGQLRGVYNKPIVLSQKPDDKFKFVCEVRSISEETGHSVAVQCKFGRDERTLVFSLPYVKELINVGIVFKALGFETEEEIRDIIGDFPEIEQYIKYIIRDSYFIPDREHAQKFIGQYAMHEMKENSRDAYALQVTENELLPHMGATSTIKEKAYFLGSMVRKTLLTACGIRKEDDRDNYTNKRVEMAGLLCYELFRTLFKRFTKSVEMQVDKKKQKPDLLSIMSKNSSITLGMRLAFATGSWGLKNNYIRTGVSQVLARMNYGAFLSHLRRVVIPIGKEGKNPKIRQTHPSQIFYICPNECFAPDTPILTWDGTIKLAKDIKVDDCLVNDTGTSVRVRSTCSGKAKMYTIKATNPGFMYYTVTYNHILTLIALPHAQEYLKVKQPSVGPICVDINLQKYLALPSYVKRDLLLFKRTNIDWPEYNNFDINTVGTRTSLETRRKTLAKIVSDYKLTETDDEYILDLTPELTQQVKFLAASIGYYTHERQGAFYLSKFVFVTSLFDVEESEETSFVGWQVDSENGRFLLADFSVTHNTPEGQSIGVVLNLALMASVTRRVPTVFVKEIIESMDNFIFINEIARIENRSKIYINGVLLGVAENTRDFLYEMEELRLSGVLDSQVSFTYCETDNEILVYSDEGRFIRPVLTIDPLTSKPKLTEDIDLTWDEMIDQGYIQYVDHSEVENSVIALNDRDLSIFKPDFMEISPLGMLGVMSSMIPFPDRTQSSRNIFQSAMSKQAIGMFATSHKIRTDTVVHVLDYPQKPLISTAVGDMLNVNEMPYGTNVIVAVLCYTGFGQEDAVIINKSSVDRGLFSTTSYKSLSCEECKQGTYSFETICLPDFDKRKNNYNYGLLDKNGIVKTRMNGKCTYVHKGDVIVGKLLTKSNKSGDEEIIDCSYAIKAGEEGFVDRVIETTNASGYKLVKVIIRVQKIPEIGDKFASRSATEWVELRKVYRQQAAVGA